MKRWEYDQINLYREIELGGGKTSVDLGVPCSMLDMMGLNGWEAVGVIGEGKHATLLFKRELIGDYNEDSSGHSSDRSDE